MSTLDNLRKEAKRWLKALRAGDGEAQARLRRVDPAAPDDPGLRGVQHALAREHGHESWQALRDAVERAQPDDPALGGAGGRTHADRVQTFLQFACWDHHVHGEGDHRMYDRAAARILRQHPEIARDSLYTAVVAGDLEDVERRLAERPALAREPGGPRGWTPLLYLCFTRLTHQPTIDNAVAIGRALLDRGANPNDSYPAGGAGYSALVGAAADGEQDAPRQPQAEALFQLLLERGAGPFDQQVLYNTHFRGGLLWWLELVHAQTVKTGRAGVWSDPEWPMLDMGGYGSGARFVLWTAIGKNDLRLAEWALSHGANPNAGPPSAPMMPKRSLYEEARFRGQTALAELLVRYGADTSPAPIDDRDRFAAACIRLDRADALAMLERHPEYLQMPEIIFAAASLNRAPVVAFLLDLGVPIEIQDEQRQRPLHQAAGGNALAAAALLIERGADADARESRYHATPLGYAVHHWHEEMIDLLVPHSRDVWNLAFTGQLDRLRELVSAEPALARSRQADGTTLLWWLPDDEETAVLIVDLLLANGADPAARNNAGNTAADWALKRGMREVAMRLTAGSDRRSGRSTRDIAYYESLARDLALAHDTGEAAALARIGDHFGRTTTWENVRAAVWRSTRTVREAGGGAGSFPVDAAREFLAHEAGFGSWAAFARSLGARVAPAGAPYVLDAAANRLEPRRALGARDWDAIINVMKERRVAALDAGSEMTDEVLERISRLAHVTHLSLGGSQHVTDAGLRHLANMPQLESLDLSNYPGSPITDTGLEVLRHLPALRALEICWQPRISDTGIANLASCERLEKVNLLGTPTGDGAIRAIAGKRSLRRLNTGRLVTDAGLPLLHEVPAFASWQGGEPAYSLMTFEAGPTHLLLDGPITDRGLLALTGLDGLFGLSFFSHVAALTPDALGSLSGLASLGFLGCGGRLCDDTAMRHIAAIPRLRMLMGQGAVATDEGFIALSRSRTIEYLWGRENPNLGSRGFAALSTMPALRGIAVSCKNVGETALATLPQFPALESLVPVGVSDAGFRHVGACERLTGLWCMYCRDTTDAATEQIAGLRLKTYYAGATQITDRSLELLGRMTSLERIELYECAGITDAGLPFLAALPGLKEIAFDGSPKITLPGTAVFPPHVQVRHSV